MTAEDWVRQTALACLDAFEAARARTMNSDDPEGPHKARVALRRLRALVKGARPILRHRASRPMVAEAKALFSILGQQRDADVRAMAEAATDPDEPARLRPKTRAALDAADAAGFAARWGAVMEGGRWQRRGRRARRWRRGNAFALAQHALDRAYAEVRDHGPRLSRMDPDTRHDLRKTLKTFRYLTEFAAPLRSGRKPQAALDRLRRMQDLLGTLTDLQMIRADGDLSAKQKSDEAMALDAAEAEWRHLRRARPWWRARR
jgi:CHAD domain-containing protein